MGQDNRARQGTPRTSGPRRRAEPDPAFEAKKDKARANMALALTIAGLLADKRPICPSCHKAEKGSVKLFADGGFKCHKCGHYVANALDLLCSDWVRATATGEIVGRLDSVDGDTIVVKATGGRVLRHTTETAKIERSEWKFRDAVEALSSGVVRGADGKPRQVAAAIEIEPEFVATPNPDLYARILELGDVEAAQEFYGRWFIDPTVVADSRAVRIMRDQRSLLAELVKDFKPEDIIAAGIATTEGYLLVNDRYPMCEPHILPDGRVASIQFRASEQTEEAIAAHKRYKADYAAQKEAAEAAGRDFRFVGDKHKYVPKFLSVMGAPMNARVGFGLPRIVELIRAAGLDVDATGTVVPGTNPIPDTPIGKLYIVEGFKDMVAARSMGLEAYGMAGAGLLPVRAVCRMFSLFDVRVSLDGDDAGESGRQRLVDHFANHGVTSTAQPPPAGKDITDVLVDKRTQQAQAS